ncbi:reverse transcriptase domain-containing protein [Trichonephila clavipes]|nr:reverse transcriptase domain-containing protein [Trichonephila clavipes]
MGAGVPQGSVLSPLLFLIFMNTIHHHIHPDTNIACFADDSAVWHSHNDITESEKALNTTLKDPELRFSKHIEQAANKALGKLNILRKLCGTSWGSRPETLKSIFCTVIRPILEYATPIWTPASISVKWKLDSVQQKAAKIIIGAVSSTNNEKAEQECGLPPLESRRNLATIKFTNKLRAYVTEFDCPQTITSTNARLRTERLKATKIHPDKTRLYVQSKHCPDLQLTPNHILECPTVATKLLKMGMVPLRDSLREILYRLDAPRIAEAVIKTFDGI